jgi:N-acyl amino acid synthase of PEP-CTERM/exosortase system
VPGRSLAVPPAESHSPRENLLEALDRFFEAVEADTPELIREAHEIRYRVYCLETGFEDPAANPDGLEKDAFDAHSVHGVLIHRASRSAMGTVRLVLPVSDALEHSFAVQQVTDHSARRNSAEFPLRSTAEVSRFCISRQFRRRATDTLYDQEENQPTAANDSAERRNGPLMRLGLIQVLVRMSARYGITHWCAVMEPKLLRMLDAMAIRFKPIGPLVEHHGIRQPCSCNIAEALSAVRKERPAFWDVLTCGGSIKI